MTPTAHFYVISNDKGFDPLIAHLREKKVFVARSKDVAGVVVTIGTTTKSTEESYGIVVGQLQRLGASRPGTVKTLSNSIAALFKKQLSSEDINNLIKQLQQHKVSAIEKTKVSYALQ